MSAGAIPGETSQGATPVVLDCGSRTCKAGFAGEDAPRSVFETLVGRPRHEELAEKFGSKLNDIYIGDEARKKRGVLSLKYPIEYGVILNFEDMEHVWQHVFDNELHVPPESQPLLCSEAPSNPRVNRERAIEIMFEKFKVPAYYACAQPVLSLYGSGLTTGIVLESGSTDTHTVPVYEGHCLSYAHTKTPVGGRTVEDMLAKVFIERDLYITKTALFQEQCREIKENCLYVVLDFDKEMQKASLDPSSVAKDYRVLSNEECVTVREEIFKAPECLFNPSLADMDCRGIHEQLYCSIMKCNRDIQTDMFENILLTGGSTMFNGFAERLQNEVVNLAPNEYNVKVIASPERKNLGWIGGSILASNPNFKEMCILREEYEEFGPCIAHKKCF